MSEPMRIEETAGASTEAAYQATEYSGQGRRRVSLVRLFAAGGIFEMTSRALRFPPHPKPILRSEECVQQSSLVLLVTSFENRALHQEVR